MRHRLALSSLLLAAAALTACGGGGGKITLGAPGDEIATTAPSADPGTETESSSDAPSETVTDDTTVDPGTTDTDTDAAAPDLEKCEEVTGSLTDLTNTIGGGPLSDAQKAQLDKVKGEMPDDIRADFELLEDGYSAIAGGDIGDMMEAGSKLSSPEFEAALERITQYVTDICS